MRHSMAAMMAASMAAAGAFRALPNIGPAPRKHKRIVSIYRSSVHGTLKTYGYEIVPGKPRPGWTYRANRRNKIMKRT